MTWQDQLIEYRKLDEINDEVMSLSIDERALVAFALFAEYRHEIAASLPSDLTDREFKEQMFFHTYGENLPDDFFKDQEIDE